jgi:ribosomal protein L40E
LSNQRWREERPDIVLARVVAHLAATVPDLGKDEARRALIKAQAETGKALWELAAYLAARPEALTIGVSDCPVAFVRLAHVLLEDGHAVSPPVCAVCGRAESYLRAAAGGRLCSRCNSRRSRIRCARCGQDGRVAARRPEGVICYRCYSNDPLVTEKCTRCGHQRLPVKRLPDGGPLCRNCYTRPARVCAACGALAPVKATIDQGPVCESCYQQPKRLCGRCGRVGPIGRRATADSPDLCQNCYQGPNGVCSVCGRTRPCIGSRSGTLICRSCFPRPRRTCCRCRRLRPVNAEWPIGPVCSTCYEHIRSHPERCARCGNLQPLIAVDDEGCRICGPCAGVVVDYTCRRCGQGGRLYADGTCTRCVLADRLQDLLQRPDGTIAPQLVPVRDALIAVEHPVTIIGWLRKSASARLLARLAAEGQLISHELLDELPQTQSLYHFRQVLVHTGVLLERVEYLERIRSWLEELLGELPSHHGRLIRPFAHWFVLRRARRRTHRRSYTSAAGHSARHRIRIAVDFLGWLDEHGLTLESVGQADIDRWLTGGPTPRRDVALFLTWAADRRLTRRFTVPARSFREPPHRLLSDEERCQQLRRCLTDTSLPIDVRAAGALIALFGIPISRIVGLTVDHISQRDETTYLTVDQHPVLLPPSLAALLRMAAQAQSQSALGRSQPRVQWLFPGSRSPGRHVASGTLGRRLRQHGIEARSTRNTALLALAADLPAPVLADLLGLHVATASRWVVYAKRDWSTYLAARAEDRREGLGLNDDSSLRLKPQEVE